MANELTFKIIDIENAIDLYKMGLIDEQACLDKIQGVMNGAEQATIVFNEPTSVFGANGGSTGDVVDTTYKITRV
jgi:hypothetical protein